MRVEFKQDISTAAYGDIKKGADVEVSEADGKAYIAGGLAKKYKEKKGDK